MIRVPYNAQVQPPAPFLLLELANPLNNTLLADVPAQLDSAADRTVIPLALLTALGLEPIDSVTIGGLGGKVMNLQVFLVSLAIKSLPARPYLIVAHPDEPWVLLGRDVLNSHRLLLDGPNLVLEIG